METKREIRKKIFQKRAEYTQEQIADMSAEIARKVVQVPAFRQAEQIYIYADYNHEVMTAAIIEEAWKRGKKVAVPKVVGKDMVFYCLEDFAQLEPGYFQIPEPVRGEVAEWEKPLMIMPGVAFTRDCRRVGYGGGFYDRFLAVHPLPTMALAFEFQILEEVPTESTDILPDMVVTEKNIYPQSSF